MIISLCCGNFIVLRLVSIVLWLVSVVFANLIMLWLVSVVL